MSDLYTELAGRLVPFLQAHWQMLVLAAGAVFLLGGIFDWKWTWDPRGYKPLGFNMAIYRRFGEKGARINTSILGAIIMLCAVLLWVIG